MAERAFDKSGGRNCFLYVLVIFMAVVMKSNIHTVIVIDSGCCDSGAAKIATDIFNNSLRVAKTGFGIYVEACLWSL